MGSKGSKSGKGGEGGKRLLIGILQRWGGGEGKGQMNKCSGFTMSTWYVSP